MNARSFIAARSFGCVSKREFGCMRAPVWYGPTAGVCVRASPSNSNARSLCVINFRSTPVVLRADACEERNFVIKVSPGKLKYGSTGCKLERPCRAAGHRLEALKGQPARAVQRPRQ